MNVIKKLVRLENDAAHFGFQWEKADQIMAQIKSECTEVADHLEDFSHPETKVKLQEEIGDLLHAVFSLCIFCQLDPLETLTNSVDKFESRFNAVKTLVQNQGLETLKGCSFSELMLYWDSAKQLVG